MAEYTASLLWTRGDDLFTDNRYSRRHLLSFDGGAQVPGSASPLHVRPPFSDPAAVDPEEAFVSALSSCHMLTFLYLAVKRGFRVDRYADTAVGVMAKESDGREWISVVTLHPEVTFSGERHPSRAEIDELHHASHGECYIANSVKTDVRCEAVYPDRESRG
ncbi:MAG: OsmC family protein [Gemmatimonadota bacterium]